MRILVARTTTGPVGGAEKAAWDHARAFIANGHQATFLTNIPRGSLAGEEKVPLIRSWLPAKGDLPAIIRMLILPGVFLHYLFIAIFRRFDVINPHSRYEQIFFSLTKPLHRAAVIWQDPGDLEYLIVLDRRGWLGRLNQKLLLRAMAKTDAIYTLSHELRDSILGKLKALGKPIDSRKLTVIRSDIFFADYNLEAKSPKKTDNLVVGTVIALHESKGVQYLLEAANALSRERENLEFWVVGDGPYRQALEAIPDKKVKGKFWGFADDISPFMKGLDIFVQPAEAEGWGRNVKEAMYFSKAVVGSRVGGIADQITNGRDGLFFKPKDSRDLADKISLLIDDPTLRAELGRAAHIKVIKEGDYVQLAAKKILPLFERYIR